MPQAISWAFQDAATARKANQRVAGVVDPGVYSGFFPIVSVSSPTQNRIDLVLGRDPVSVIITSEGVRIEENANLVGIVQFINPSSTLTRYDMVILEYQFTNDRNVSAVYKVLQGAFAPIGTEPVKPEIQNPYQVPICFVRIRPVAAGSGPSLVQLLQSDLLAVIRGQDVTHPDEMGALKPIVNPADTNSQTLYVYPGSFPSVDRSTIIEYPGGYSKPITDNATVAAMAIGDTQFWTAGIADDGSVALIEQLTNYTDSPTNVESSVPLCVLEIRNPSGTIQITNLRDIRQFITRLGTGNDENDQWADMFAQTIFQEMVYDPFTNLEKVFVNSLEDTGLTPNINGLSLELDQAQTALVLRYDGSADIPSGDVTVVLGDFIAGSNIAAIRELVVMALHDVPGLGTSGLQYRYSFSGVFSGYQPPATADALPLGNNVDTPIIATPGGSPTSLYIKFVFPNSLFSLGTPVEYRIFSLGFQANIDPSVAVGNIILDDARTTQQNSIRNLIGNDFNYWSYPNDTTFAVPNDPASSAFAMLISGVSSDISGGLKQVGPDGWQAVWKTAGAIPSVQLLRYQRGASGDDRRFLLQTTISAIAAVNAGEFLLEFRVPAALLRMGDPVSMAVNVDVNVDAVAGMSIRLYARNTQNQLVIASESSPVYAPSGFTRMVSSTGVNKIDASHTAVGFVLRLRQSAAVAVTAKWADPVGAAGDFSTVLPFSPPADPETFLKHFVSVLRMVQKGFVSEPTPVAVAMTLPVKFRSLGTPRVTLVPLPGFQNSVNVSSLSGTVDDQGQTVVLEGQALQEGAYGIDSVLLVDVFYEREI